MATVTAANPTIVPGLLSPYDKAGDKAGGLVYFPRMISKIRLHAEGKLPESHTPFLGAAETFDAECVRFLGVTYEAIRERALATSDSPEELLEWCFQTGRRPLPEEIEIWNSFASKAGWRDSMRSSVVRRLKEANLPLDGPILTMFDYIDVDEGRPLRNWDDCGAE